MREQAATVIATVAQTRATWQINHVRAEAQRLLRYADHHGGKRAVDRIVAAAIAEHSTGLTCPADTEMNEPAALRRRDGASVYTGHDTTIYTSADVLAAERRILAAAAGGGRVVDETSIGLALLHHHAQDGFELNDGQVQLVRALATSGARVQLALSARRHRQDHRHGRARRRVAQQRRHRHRPSPTASAAEVLAEETGITTETMPNSFSSPTPPATAAAQPAATTRPENWSTASTIARC